jgi:hypothetical protein
MARIFVIQLKETPKFLLGEGKDAECVEVLQGIATKYNRPCSLTLEALQACGITSTRETRGKSKWGPGEIGTHLKGLYATKRIGISTTLIWLSWTLIGKDSLFNVGIFYLTRIKGWPIHYTMSSCPPTSPAAALPLAKPHPTSHGATTPSSISAASGVPFLPATCATHHLGGSTPWLLARWLPWPSSSHTHRSGLQHRILCLPV